MSEIDDLGPCEAIEGFFSWGVQRCMKPSVTEAVDEMWGTVHPVCAEHAPAGTDKEA
jgi:hypothetical protein